MFSQEKLPANQYLVYALGGSFGLQLLSAAIPGLRSILKLAPINVVDGVVIGTTALLPLLINEGTKGGSGGSRRSEEAGEQGRRADWETGRKIASSK
jgi:Ca2+-transporting ATPase